MKKGILKNFTKFTGKHQRQSLFSNSVGGLRLATLLKKRVWHSCFPMNLANFQEHRFYRKPLGDYFWLHFLFFYLHWCIFNLAGISSPPLREQCPDTGFFLVRIFPHSAWIRRYTVSLISLIILYTVFSPNAGKY